MTSREMQGPANKEIENPRRRIIRWLLFVAWGAAIIGYLSFSRQRGLGPTEIAQEFQSLLADHWWGAALFIGLYVARPVVLFPASVLTILGGLAFGPWWGTVLTIVASNLSTAANYAVGRFSLSTPFLDGGDGPVRSAIGRAADRPFETTLVMRLIALPFDPVAYVAGLARLSFWPFLAGSALGTMVGTIAFVLFGASIESLEEGAPTIDLRLVAISVALTVGGIVAARVIRARRPLSPESAMHSPEVSI